MALTITSVSPIQLDGALDSSNDLQLHYGTSSLADHSDALHAFHDTQPVRIEIHDFTVGTVTWTINAVHVDGASRTVNWTRGTGLCYHDWYYTDELDVDVTATSSSGTKTKKFYVKVKPLVELPDR